MRLWLAAVTAVALALTACASPGSSSSPAASAPAGSAPFYLEQGSATPAVDVINGFTGQAVAAIAAPAGAGSFPWAGRTTWYPCGAAPDDRMFLLCGADQYWELRPASILAPWRRITRRKSRAAQDPKEAHPAAARAVISGGNGDAVDLRVAGLELETHPLVKRDRATVHW